LAAVMPAGAAPPPKPPRYDIAYSREVVTPHVPWATTLPGGPIRGFFIPSVAEGRDMVELMQRLALDPTTVTIDRNWDVNCWGIGDFYGHEYRGDRDDFQTVYGYVEEELTSAKRFEVMVIPGLNGWTRLTRASRDAILRRVTEGAGLVLLHPFVGDVKGHPFKGDEGEGDPRLWEISPLVGVPDDYVSERGYPEPNAGAIAEGRWERGTPHFITEGVPLGLIPSGRAGGRFYKYEPRGDVLIAAAGHPDLAVKPYGKGRVAAFAYVEDGLLPKTTDPIESKTSWNYWEYQYALVARAVMWAAGRDQGPGLEAPRFDGVSGKLELAFVSPESREVEIETLGRNESGTIYEGRREKRAVTAGRNSLSLSLEGLKPPGGWPGGRQILDVIVRDPGGATLGFGSATFEIPKTATVTGVRPNAEVYREGDTMSIVTRAAGKLEGLRMRVEVRDDLGRLLHAEEKPTPGEKAFVYRLDDFVGKKAKVTASLVDGARVIDQLRAAPVVVVQAERRRKEYQGLMSFEDPRPFLAETRQRRMRARAMDSGFTWGGKVNDSLEVPRGWFGVYWYDRGPTTPEGMEKAIADFERTGDFASLQYLTKKELFKRTGDKRFLVRGPSLDDPEVQRTLADGARTAARNKAVYNMDYYFVGDEGSLTSYTDPVDFCFGPHTLSNFRRWLREQYGSLEALNRTWQSAFADWDSVVPATTEEARKTGVFPPWADHRTYMEISFANAYSVVRKAVVEGDPEGRIALSGTQVTTPWNGADWSRLDRIVDDFLSYDGGNQWDMHRSFAKPDARVGFWTGYGRRGVGVRHEIWSAALQGVLFPNLFWSYSVVNPDLTWSASGRDMGSAFEALRFEGVGKLLMEATRVHDGIAVHYSMASVHAAGILGLHDRGRKEGEDAPGFPANRDGWVRSLTDLGLSFDFVSSAQVEAGGLDP
ncbi:MAG TPA: beta-galactosidase, partial [Vicinamibacteria bacterium]